jgi:hypothetical protein
MVQLMLCIALLLPLVALPVGAFLLSTILGIVIAVVATVLSVPLLLSALAHLDLMRMKSRYGLSDEELAEFTRLVPTLVMRSRSSGLGAGQSKRAAQAAAADMICERRRDAKPSPNPLATRPPVEKADGGRR